MKKKELLKLIEGISPETEITFQLPFKQNPETMELFFVGSVLRHNKLLMDFK